jgi:hypothetical protein
LSSPQTNQHALIGADSRTEIHCEAQQTPEDGYYRCKPFRQYFDESVIGAPNGKPRNRLLVNKMCYAAWADL